MKEEAAIKDAVIITSEETTKEKTASTAKAKSVMEKATSTMKAKTDKKAKADTKAEFETNKKKATEVVSTTDSKATEVQLVEENQSINVAETIAPDNPLSKEVIGKMVKETTKQIAEKVKKPTETVTKVAKSAVTKAVQKKEATKATTKAIKEDSVVTEIYIQYTNEQAVLDEVIESIKEEYVLMGHRIGTLKSLQVYLKPEEYKAYYVINKKMAGSVPLFQ